MSKIDMCDLLRGTSFFKIGAKTALLKGKIKNRDIMKLKDWLTVIYNEAGQGYILVLDSIGGISDPKVLEMMFKIPLHVHVAGNTQSFASLMALSGSYKTCTDDPAAFYMFHRAEWAEKKEAEEVAECDELLFRHRYTTVSMLAKLMPSGELKDVVCEASTTGNIDAYVLADALYECGAIDEIVHYTGADLGLYKDCEEWYDKTYPYKEPADG